MAQESVGHGTRPARPPSPRRADAERNIATIMAAAQDLFTRNSSVSMADVAKAAGLGRVTVYAHFPSRADLVDALIRKTIAQTEQTLAELLTDSDQESADQLLARLLGSTWQTVANFGKLRAHALADLGAARLNHLHDPIREPLQNLILQGRRQGVFRADLPPDWLVTTVYGLVHAAMDEVENNRLDPAAVPGLLAATLLAALRPQPASLRSM